MFEEVKEITNMIESDFGGGSSLSKTYLMAYLIRTLDLKTYVEIGVYKGRSLFPAAAAVYRNGGKAYGIDPYNLQDAYEYEVSSHVGDVNGFLDKLDFEGIYDSVLRFKEDADYGECIKLIRKTSDDAVDYFEDNKIVIDMLHIDGNHDSKFVQLDVNNYCSRVKDGGIIVFDDIDWDSVRGCYEEYKNSCRVLFETNNFGILYKLGRDAVGEDRTDLLSNKLSALYEKLQKIDCGQKKEDNDITPLVGIGILTYRHEKYISQCLESVFSQKGNFRTRIVIIDDCSDDNTRKVIAKYIKMFKNRENCEIIFKSNPVNKGVVKNLQQCLNYFTDCDYFTFCEGDDYWTDGLRIEKLMGFIRNNPEISLCFNKMQLYYEDKELFTLNGEQNNLFKEVYTTADLISNNFIGNFTTCFYDARFLKNVDETIFDIYTVDWFFNTYYSIFGDIGFYNKTLSVYRKHSQGEWTGMETANRNRKLIELIDIYNEKLKFAFDKEYSLVKNITAQPINNVYLESYDLLILDGCFPLEKSAFRFVEFNNILANISTKILTDGSDINNLTTEATSEVIKNYKRRYPRFSSKVDEFSEIFSEYIDFKLMYFVFLNNAFKYVDFAMRKRKPFVFTLYPGGGFAFNNEESDVKLKKVMSAPNFKKVIVTQKPIYDYLIKKKFCNKEQIEYIFGVVTETKMLNMNIEKKHFGIDKDRLDVCFVAFKYTHKGTDKGYDIFIETAKKLCAKNDNIYFHVVGNFDETVIDVSDISNRITFYGTKDPAWFDEFYKDKDIILSPNKPDQLFKGSFDGFPTTACIDAGICKTALFCTDPLDMNDGFFVDRQEIVIIPHNAEQITEIIMHYYDNPEELKAISDNGREKILKLYSYENQIKPRIELLKKEIAEPFVYKDPSWIKSKIWGSKTIFNRVITKMKNKAPKPVKVIYKRIKVILHG